MGCTMTRLKELSDLIREAMDDAQDAGFDVDQIIEEAQRSVDEWTPTTESQ